MRSVAHAAQGDPSLVVVARRIVESTRDPDARAASLRRWLSGVVPFRRDPPHLEQITTPQEQLRQIAQHGQAPGDCDDAATLGAALAIAMQMPCRFVLLGFQGPAGPFAHVFAEVWTGRAWRELDVTRGPSSVPPSRRWVTGV